MLLIRSVSRNARLRALDIPSNPTLGVGARVPGPPGRKPLFAFGQYRWGGRGWRNRMPPKFPAVGTILDDSFTFCRVLYESVRDERSGYGWNTDYPLSDINFMTRFSQLTTARIPRDGDGVPDHVVVSLLDDTIYRYPYVFMSDVGTMGLNPFEADRLRDYLLKGGILYVDDFWGDLAWEHWEREIGKVLPPDEYPIVDIPMDHEILQTFFTIRKVPQIPSIHHWRRSGGTTTSERGWETRDVHFRGISDHKGRLMVIMTHNTDIADGWEREGEEYEYFYRFSIYSYPVGVNIAIYAMTH